MNETEKAAEELYWDELGKISKAPEEKQMPWVRFFKPEKDKTILELGCHKGANLLEWGRNGHICHGEDPSAHCIERFIANCHRLWIPGEVDWPRNCTARVGFAEDYKLAEGAEPWDYVVMASMLESVYSPVMALKAARAALKPVTGRLYVVVLNQWFNGKGPSDTQKRCINDGLLLKLFRESGLRAGQMWRGGVHGHFQFAWAWNQEGA